MDPIKFATPDCGEAEAQAAAEVIRSGWIVGGPKLAELEGLFAAHTGRKHAVGVTSWTTGGFLALYAWGIGPGDEVIVPSYSFIATANVVRHVGATPVFADIEYLAFRGASEKALGVACTDIQRRAVGRRDDHPFLQGLLQIHDAGVSSC